MNPLEMDELVAMRHEQLRALRAGSRARRHGRPKQEVAPAAGAPRQQMVVGLDPACAGQPAR